MTVPQPVRSGTAEQLARLAHFRGLAVRPDGTDDPDAGEIDTIAHWLIGDAGMPLADRQTCWRQIRPLAEHLWVFVNDDWDEDDLDPMSVQEAELPAGHGWDSCADRTRERLTAAIEQQVWLTRYRAAEARRGVAR